MADRARSSAGPADAAGWVHCALPIESIDAAVGDLLRFGAEVEVLAPAALRQALKDTLDRTLRFYSAA